MTEIVVTALNAKYIHASLGARYLLANLKELRKRSVLVELDINQRPIEIVEAIMIHQPKIVGFGVYIWNVGLVAEVVSLLKTLRPELVVVLGGPEVSYETPGQPVTQLADFVIAGEADLLFAEFCRQVLDGNPPGTKILPAASPDLENVELPYDLYLDGDLSNRLTYVEISRGCPYRCEFCLSSRQETVRRFPLETVCRALARLLERGARRFKFVDRTFNLSVPTSLAVLDFLGERLCPDLLLHFEMIPDRWPPELRKKIQEFPPGVLQFEVGIQTFNPEVAERIQRRQDYAQVEDTLRFLRAETGARVHADLLVGLPGEDWGSLASGFDRLVALRPHEIQVGILKRLRGAPIGRHDVEWGMRYSPLAPYEILENKCIEFHQMQRLKRFARAWEMVANGGEFADILPWLWRKSDSPFAGFMQWTDWLHRQIGRAHSVALTRQAELIFRFLTREQGCQPEEIAPILLRDYQRSGRSDRPVFLRAFLPPAHQG